MGILALAADERVQEVQFTDDTMSVDLIDGRTITVPWLRSCLLTICYFNYHIVSVSETRWVSNKR